MSRKSFGKIEFYKQSFSSSLGNVVDIFGSKIYATQTECDSPVDAYYRLRPRPSRQTFAEAIHGNLSFVGDALRFSVLEYGKRRRS